MKINKEFVNILSTKKDGRVGDIIKEMEILDIQENNIQNLNKHYKTLEQIFYTVYFLEKEELIHAYVASMEMIPSFNFSEFERDKFLADRLSYIHDLIKEYWGKRLKITLKFYNFIDNGYKTDQQKEKILNIWVPIGVAILASVLTALLPFLFRVLFC